MKNIIYLLLIQAFFVQVSIAQNNNVICSTCGPEGYENERENVENGEELTEPYDGIFHLRVTRGFFFPNVSTASFIENDLIITANHNVMYSPFITKIEFFLDGKWNKINRGRLRIYHYHRGLFHNRRKDIALIKLKKTDSIEQFHHTNFTLKNYDDINGKEKLIFHLTGFPCDRPRVLVDKVTTSKELVSDSSNKIISYEKLYTCTGDSGAPLWFEENGEYYLTSIHHGGNDVGGFDNRDTNIGIKINWNVIKWIDEK